MKALGFFYDWSGRRTLDPYFRQVAQAFGELGIELDVVLANELRHPWGGQETIHPAFDQDKLIAWIRENDVDFIFSVNNAGLTDKIVTETSIPIVVWLVDDLPHLFFHDGFGDPEDRFVGRERIFCYASTLAQQIAAVFPHARDRVGWMPHGTNLTASRFKPGGEIIPIGFVGSCLPVDGLVRLLAIARRHGVAREVLDHLRQLGNDYVVGSGAIAPSPELRATMAEAGLGVLDYHRMLADALTTQERAEALQAVADLGLHLWGNTSWFDTLICTSAIVESFQFDTMVATPEQLNDTYARSRITVNIPNVQNCAGLAVRVFDAMASPSLLITKHHPDSDLFRLFGPDCPVPMYRDAAHLRELCAYYLEHEDERRRVVEACNRLIDGRFLLRNRIRAMLEASDIALPDEGAETFTPDIVAQGRFHGWPSDWIRLRPWTSLVAKTAVRKAVAPIVATARAWLN